MAVLARAGNGMISVAFLYTMVFFLMRLVPGDPARLMAGVDATQQQVDMLRKQLGFDEPIGRQYLSTVTHMAKGDFGDSTISNHSVLHEITTRLPDTLVLAAAGMAIAIVLSGAGGILAAKFHGTRVDLSVTAWAITTASVPYFWLALVLVDWFAVRWGLLPAGGAGSWQHLVLPALVIACTQIGLITRVIRSSLIDCLRADYVRTAKAKGVSQKATLFHHVLRNALVPAITVTGLNAGLLVGGAVVVETIFNWPGVARLLIQAVVSRDYPVIQGLILLFGITFIIVNLLVDLVNLAVDPRLRSV